jgi:hypothetical protein
MGEGGESIGMGSQLTPNICGEGALTSDRILCTDIDPPPSDA